MRLSVVNFDCRYCERAGTNHKVVVFILTDIDSVQAKLLEQEHVTLQTREIVVCNRIYANFDLVRDSSDEELRDVRIRHHVWAQENSLLHRLSRDTARESRSVWNKAGSSSSRQIERLGQLVSPTDEEL